MQRLQNVSEEKNKKALYILQTIFNIAKRGEKKLKWEMKILKSRDLKD